MVAPGKILHGLSMFYVSSKKMWTVLTAGYMGKVEDIVGILHVESTSVFMVTSVWVLIIEPVHNRLWTWASFLLLSREPKANLNETVAQSQRYILIPWVYPIHKNLLQVIMSPDSSFIWLFHPSWLVVCPCSYFHFWFLRWGLVYSPSWLWTWNAPSLVPWVWRCRVCHCACIKPVFSKSGLLLTQPKRPNADTLTWMAWRCQQFCISWNEHLT